MYNAKFIIPGLIVFLLLVLFPFVKGFGTPEMKVELEKPKTAKQCVLKTEQMRDAHMVLLNEWRDMALREDKRVYTAPDGKKYDISLTNTCLQCHENKEKFCDKCHNEVGVDPYCFSCHNLAPVKKEGGK
jgi:hypothetical protein